MSFDPPLVGIGLRKSRFSYDIIKETGIFVINIPSIDLASQVMWTGKQTGREVDKFKETGLTAVPGVIVSVPHIAECLGFLECTVHDQYESGDHVWIIGKIIHHDVDPEKFLNGKYRTGVKLLYYYLDSMFGTIDQKPQFFEPLAKP